MNKVKDVIFMIIAFSTPLPNPIVSIELALNNESPRNYYVVRNVILLDGISVIHFFITGPSKILCFVQNHSTSSELILLSKGISLNNSLSLSDYCDFHKVIPGKYSIDFNTYLNLYNTDEKPIRVDDVSDTDSFIHIIGNTGFII